MNDQQMRETSHQLEKEKQQKEDLEQEIKTLASKLQIKTVELSETYTSVSNLC